MPNGAKYIHWAEYLIMVDTFVALSPSCPIKCKFLNLFHCNQWWWCWWPVRRCLFVLASAWGRWWWWKGYVWTMQIIFIMKIYAKKFTKHILYFSISAPARITSFSASLYHPSSQVMTPASFLIIIIINIFNFTFVMINNNRLSFAVSLPCAGHHLCFISKISQAVSLPCSTVGNPPPRLSWIHRDSLVYSGEQFQVMKCGFWILVFGFWMIDHEWWHRDSLVYSGEQFQVKKCELLWCQDTCCAPPWKRTSERYVVAQVLSDGTLLMKEVRENIEELTCQVDPSGLLTRMTIS